MSLVSIRGRIGRAAYVGRFFVGLIIMFIGFLVPVLIGLLSVPWANESATSVIWSEQAAEFVGSTIGAIDRKWIILSFLILGGRVVLCAIVQRARDLGVELGTVLEVPLHWLNPLSKANCGHLLASPGIAQSAEPNQTPKVKHKGQS